MQTFDRDNMVTNTDKIIVRLRAWFLQVGNCFFFFVQFQWSSLGKSSELRYGNMSKSTEEYEKTKRGKADVRSLFRVNIHVKETNEFFAPSSGDRWRRAPGTL